MTGDSAGYRAGREGGEGEGTPAPALIQAHDTWHVPDEPDNFTDSYHQQIVAKREPCDSSKNLPRLMKSRSNTKDTNPPSKQAFATSVSSLYHQVKGRATFKPIGTNDTF